jgi:lysozyme
MSRLRKSGYAAALAVSLIGGFEGLRTTAYLDSVKIPTVCYGETKGIHLGMKFTKDQCDAMFVSRLDEFATKVEACVKRPMSDKTLVAFTSLSYNIGSAGFCNSSVVREYNKGNAKLACNKMEAFNKAGGRVLLGLVRRRSAESALCLEGINE